MKYKCGCNHHKLCASFLKYQGQKCLGAGNVSGTNMSQGWTCLRCLKFLLYKKAEKDQKYLGARLVQALLGQTCLRAGLVSGPDLSRGRTCPKTSGPDLSKSFRAGSVSRPDLSKNFGAGLVQKLQGRKCLAAGIVQKFRARSVSRPDLVRGRKCLGAGDVSGLDLF
jgi:hypothetical protein